MSLNRKGGWDFRFAPNVSFRIHKTQNMDALLPEQVKQAQRFARIAGKSLCLFWSAAAGKGERKALLTDKFELEIFALRCENLLL